MIPDINEIAYIINKISYILYKVYAIIDIFMTYPGVLGSIPGLATCIRFSFRFFKKGSSSHECKKVLKTIKYIRHLAPSCNHGTSCQSLAKVCARSTG